MENDYVDYMRYFGLLMTSGDLYLVT